MKHRSYLPILLLMLFVLAAQPASSDIYEGATVTPLIKTSTASDGSPIVYPKVDRPEVTALLVELPSGAETGWHRHHFLFYAYVISGTIMLEMDNGKKKVYCEGDVIIEALNRPHNGRNTGTAMVKMVVFASGEEGAPIAVKVPRPDLPDDGH